MIKNEGDEFNKKLEMKDKEIQILKTEINRFNDDMKK